jgi:iron complex transport system substrate-binding protein
LMRRYLMFDTVGVAAAVLLAVVAAASAQAAKPVRVVSLDVCADQLLIELVEPERIAAVTHLAADPEVSASWQKAKGLPVTRGAAEDVLGHRPDLVLAGPFGVAPTVGLLRRLKANVVIVPMASDLDGVRAAVRAVAAAVGEEARGAAIVAAFDRRLAQARPAAPLDPASTSLPPSAIVYQVGGAVSGAGSLADAALVAAGFRNKAAEYRLTRTGQVPLELLAASPPDLIVLSSALDEYRTVVSDNLRHPAFRRVRAQRASIVLPWRLWLCGTPQIADTIVRLAEVRAGLKAQR